MRFLLIVVVVYSGVLNAKSPALAHSVNVVTELSPPHQTLENDKVAGLSTALVRRTLGLAEIDAEFTIYPWARAFNIAHSEPNTLIYNMARTPAREKQFHWIGTVAEYQFAFVKLARRTDISIQSIAQAKEYSIAVQRDDVASDWLQTEGFTEQQHKVMTSDIAGSWDLLIKGKVDLIVEDPQLFATMQQKLGLEDGIVVVAYPISALNQKTWLAANIDSSDDLVRRLKVAYAAALGR